MIKQVCLGVVVGALLIFLAVKVQEAHDKKPLVFKLVQGVVCDGSTDDRPAIQAELDRVGALPHGGTVVLPGGVCVIGTPNASGNKPLFVWSNTTLAGAGRGVTVLKVSDEANQLVFGASQSAGTADVYSAGLIANKHSPWWVQQEASILDRNIAIRDLSLDGNRDHQSKIMSQGNMTVDPYIPNAWPDGASISASTGSGSLIPGHTYRARVTWTDNSGNETECGPGVAAVTLPADKTAVQVSPANPPYGAHGLLIYLRDDADPWLNGKSASGAGWERLDEILPASASPIVVLSHSPGTAIPNGYGILNKGEASASAGIFLDHVERVIVENVDAMNFVVDGIIVGGPFLSAHVSDVSIKGMRAFDNYRCAVAVTGNVQRMRVSDLESLNNGMGVDLEPAFELTISDIRFIDSVFQGSHHPGGYGVAIGPPALGISDVSFVNTRFADNLIHVGIRSLAQGPAKNIIFDSCSFVDGLNIGMSIESPGYGKIINSTFVNGSKNLGTPPNYYPGATEAPVISFQTLASGWLVQNNTFRQSSPPGVNGYQIQNRGANVKNNRFIGNVMDVNGGTRNFLLYFDAPNNYQWHTISGNVDGVIRDQDVGIIN